MYEDAVIVRNTDPHCIIRAPLKQLILQPCQKGGQTVMAGTASCLQRRNFKPQASKSLLLSHCYVVRKVQAYPSSLSSLLHFSFSQQKQVWVYLCQTHDLAGKLGC